MSMIYIKYTFKQLLNQGRVTGIYIKRDYHLKAINLYLHLNDFNGNRIFNAAENVC